MRWLRTEAMLGLFGVTDQTGPEAAERVASFSHGQTTTPRCKVWARLALYRHRSGSLAVMAGS